MELQFKPDLEAAHRRWDDFWSGRPMDRPILHITVPKPAARAAAAAGKPLSRPYPIRPDHDPVPQVEQILAWTAAHEHLGEAIPCHTLEFSPEQFAAMLGAQMDFRSGTGWIIPCVENWDDTELVLRRDGDTWQRTLEFIAVWRKHCDGKLLTCAPVLSAGLDCLSALRGPERLAMDLVDCPEKVHRALAQVRIAYRQIVTELGRALGWADTGTCNWMGMYHRRSMNALQCDFSCMIGTEQFAEFAVPALRDEARYFEALAYHLDGPQAAHHLPALCAMPEIGVIQYVPIPREDPEHVEAVYRQALSLGKAIIRPADVATVRRMWAERSRGSGGPMGRMIFSLWMQSRAEAEELLGSFA